MMAFDRFVLHPTQKYTYTPLGCPVRICCSRQCTESRSGVNFLQVRMENLTDRFIFNVVVSVEAFDARGEKLYELRSLVLSNCNAQAGEVFGEEQMIALPGQVAASLSITVDYVVFDDGMLWRKDTIYRRKKTLPEIATTAADACETTAQQDAPVEAHEETIPEQIVAAKARFAASEEQKPEPILRTDWTPAAPAQKKRSYAWLICLLVIFGIGLVASVLYLLHIYGGISEFFVKFSSKF